MAEPFRTQDKLYEIISNLQEYNSPEKIEDLKTELKFLQEWDPDNSINIVDFGQSVVEALLNSATNVVSYIFCFPGCQGGNISEVNQNLRIVPVSTAFAGMYFNPGSFSDKGYFIGAYLRNIKFRHGDLAGADFTGADLTNATFEAVILTDAKIHGANFCGADLSGSTMPEYADTITKFKEVVGKGNWDTKTKWVNGTYLT